MKKEIMVVPKDKNLADFFKEMEREGLLKSAWLIVHEDVYAELVHMGAAGITMGSGATLGFGGVAKWTFLYSIQISHKENIPNCEPYYTYNNIDAAGDPENIFFIKRES